MPLGWKPKGQPTMYPHNMKGIPPTTRMIMCSSKEQTQGRFWKKRQKPYSQLQNATKQEILKNWRKGSSQKILKYGTPCHVCNNCLEHPSSHLQLHLQSWRGRTSDCYVQGNPSLYIGQFYKLAFCDWIKFHPRQINLWPWALAPREVPQTCYCCWTCNVC